MRIGYLCGEYPRVSDTFIQREVGALRNQEFFVRTFSIRRPKQRERGTHEQEFERAQTKYILPVTPWRLIADHFLLLLQSPCRYLRAIYLAATVRSPGLLSFLYQLFYFAEAGVVARRMQDERLQHLHNHAPDASGYVTMIAAEMGGFTYSMTLHGFGILSEPTRWRLRDKLDRALFSICVSWYARSQAMLWSDQKIWDRHHVIHCGITTKDFTVRNHHGEGKRLLFVGRFDHVKGLFLLIEAVERLARDFPLIRLELVGDGPQRTELEEIVRRKQLLDHVTFHGYLSQAQIRQQLAQADVCVMSSFAEGIPVVLMEAMAAGIPVVAPRIAGIPELVEHERSGLLYHPGCADGLVNALHMVINDPQLRNRFARQGRKVVMREFELETEVGRLVDVMHGRLAGLNVPIGPKAPPADLPVDGSLNGASHAVDPLMADG
jgi:colanic acid/amylovoran biosynthesis glycosyltransferase